MIWSCHSCIHILTAENSPGSSGSSHAPNLCFCDPPHRGPMGRIEILLLQIIVQELRKPRRSEHQKLGRGLKKGRQIWRVREICSPKYHHGKHRIEMDGIRSVFFWICLNLVCHPNLMAIMFYHHFPHQNGHFMIFSGYTGAKPIFTQRKMAHASIGTRNYHLIRAASFAEVQPTKRCRRSNGKFQWPPIGHLSWSLTSSADRDSRPKTPKTTTETMEHGSLNVPIEHHPTIGYMVYKCL